MAETDPKKITALRWNLLCFLLIGTIICFWFWRNTDEFENLAALLTFGGALSWLAVALKIVPEEKTKQLQTAFFENVFENPRACPWLLVLLILVTAATFCFATIQLQPLQESVDRPVIICAAQSGNGRENDFVKQFAEGDFETLKPGGRLRIVVPVWWRYKNYFVKVSGYPDKLVTLQPWQRKELVLPNSFRRRVVLLRPTERLINNARQANWMLTVRTKNSSKSLEMPFDGHSVWLGCDANVEVPIALHNIWEGQIAPLLKQYWIYPQAFSNANIELPLGETFEVQLRAGNGLLQPAVTKTVGNVATRPDFFPQVIDIDSAN